MTAAATSNVRSVTEHPACGGGSVRVLGLHRCPGCGHRLTVNGTPPRQTREQPYRAPAEILGRRLAKRAA